jgi:hypothetical protein
MLMSYISFEITPAIRVPPNGIYFMHSSTDELKGEQDRLVAWRPMTVTYAYTCTFTSFSGHRARDLVVVC